MCSKKIQAGSRQSLKTVLIIEQHVEAEVSVLFSQWRGWNVVQINVQDQKTDDTQVFEQFEAFWSLKQAQSIEIHQLFWQVTEKHGE
jgi:hypothetical protein